MNRVVSCQYFFCFIYNKWRYKDNKKSGKLYREKGLAVTLLVTHLAAAENSFLSIKKHKEWY